MFPVGSALLRSEDGVEYAYIFSQPSVTISGGTVLPEVVQTWVFDTADDLVAPNVVLIESIVSDDSITIAVAGGQSDVTLRNDATGAEQANILTDFYRLEAQYSGLAYWIVHSDVYFGSEAYAASDFRMGFYGLATPSSGQPLLGLAAYEGKVFGSYSTAAAADRFLIGGDIELLVDFDAGEVSGEASLEAYTTALVLTDPESTVVIELADGSIGSDGSFEGSDVSVKTAGTGVLIGLTAGVSASRSLFKGMFTGPQAQEVAGRADLVGTGYALRFGFVAQEVEVEAEEIPEVIITKIEEDLQSGETEQPTAKPGQSFEEDANTTVVFPTEEEEAIVRTNNGNTFVLKFEEDNEADEKVVQTWTFNTSDPAQTVADNVTEIQVILGTSLDISGSRSEVKRRDSGGVERDLNVDAYLFEGSHAGFGLWLERPEGFFGSGSYSPGGTPVAVRFYGLATPTADFQAGGIAAYEGQAAGAFVRNYISGTIAAADRYTIAGDIELEVDFGNSTIGGSAVLQAYTTSFAATSPVSRVSLGLVNGLLDRDNASFAGSVEITAGGTGVLNGLTPGLTPGRAAFSGIFSGPKADEAVGRAEFRTGVLALQFGFLATRENEVAGITPSVLSATRTSVDAGTTIPQPPAGSESFAGETANDLVLPSDGGAVIRSKDGSEYAYVFKQGGNTRALTFTVSEPGTAAAAKARSLRDLADAGYSVAGGRDPAADGYVIERRYSGLGIWAQGAADAFFGSGSYSSADLLLSIYGLATPSAGIPESVALYVGRAFGVYLKNIEQDSSVAAAYRFVVSGELEIEADFEQDMIQGSVQLVAHRLTNTAEIAGSSAAIALAETSLANGEFSGDESDVSVLEAQGIFASLNGITLSDASGYSGFLTGPAGDELVGRTLLLASNGSQRLEFGFIGEYLNVIPLGAEALAAVEAKVLAGVEIEQPVAGSESLASLTEAPLVFPATDEAAIVRSRDGFEFAYVFTEGDPAAVRTWYFAAAGRNTVSSRISSISSLVADDIGASGLRSEVTRLDDSNTEETFEADIYVLEASHAGVGLWVEKPDEFFGAGAYGTAGTPVGAVFYGLTPATNPSAGTAAYAGSAIGGYMRNIQGDGTVAAADRFLISGDVELTADFSNRLIIGSADLTAHSLDLAQDRGTVGIGLSGSIGSDTSFAGNVQITTGGTAQLIALSLGLSADSSEFSGLIAGPAAQSVAGRAIVRAAAQALLFGFAASADGAIHRPANPIAASVLTNAQSNVDGGTAIAQPTAGSETFDSTTATNLTFPTFGGSSLIRSRDGSEYAHVFKVESDVYAWRFAVGNQAATANVLNIIARLNSTEIEVFGARNIVSQGDSIFSVDAYIFEGAYSGFGLYAEEPEKFFDSTSNDYQSRRVGVRHYGWAAPAAVGFASYTGKAAGGYMRNIQGDGTAAGSDRFVISGTVELTADFGNDTLLGSADLVAHSLSIAAASLGAVKIGLSGTLTSGNVDVQTRGTDALSGLTAGLSHDDDSGLYSGLLAGTTGQEFAASVEFVAGDQGLLFGFIVSQGTVSTPTTPIAVSVLTSARSNVDSGTAISQPAAGSETFDDPTAADLTFPASGGSALIRSKNGSEYAYVFKADSAVHAWRFAAGNQDAADNVSKITARLNSADIEVFGARNMVSQGDSIFNADAYAFEGEYSGFVLLISNGSDLFFGNDNYDDPDVSIRPRFYGLQSPVFSHDYTATYEGKAIGAYIRNISGSGNNRTSSSSNRFFVYGDVSLAADFEAETITGTADLTASGLNISSTIDGDVGIGFNSGAISDSLFSGDVAIRTAGRNAFSLLTQGLTPDNISGFDGVIAGTGAQEIAGRALFSHNDEHILQFGFVAPSTTTTVPSWVIATELLEAARTKLDADQSIDQPAANSIDVFDSDTPTAETMTFPVAGGALIRAPDGSRYVLVQKTGTFERTGFKPAPTNLIDATNYPNQDCNDGALLTENNPVCYAKAANSGDHGLAVFKFEFVNMNFVSCIVAESGNSSLAVGASCGLERLDYLGLDGGVTEEVTQEITWGFSSSSVQAVENNAANIETIVNSSDIDVFGSRSRFDHNDSTIDVDAYILESSYAGFGIWAEDPETLFDGTDGTYTAEELSIHYYGMATPAGSVPAIGSASYSGKTFGIHMRDTNADSAGFRSLVSSDFSATASFTDRSINMTFGTISAYELDYSPTTAIGTAQLTAFDVSITANSSAITGKVKVAEDTTGTGVLSDFTNPTAVAEGEISGLLAGPGYEEMVGSLSLTEAGDVLKMGFIGSKQ